MKVCIILPEPYSPTHGGALATWTHEVYRLLDLDATVISKPTLDYYNSPQVEFCQTNFFEETLYKMIQNRSIKGFLNSPKSWLQSSYGRGAGRLCTRLSSDIIHVHNAPNLVLPIRYSNPKTPIILHMNNDHLLTCSNIELERISIEVNSIAFCSEYIRQNALKKIPSLPQEKTFLISNGASGEFHVSTKKSFTDNPVLLFVGRLVPDKGLHILLESLDAIFEHFPKTTLRIVGGTTFGSHQESEYVKDLKIQSSKWKNQVIFVGPIAHDRIFEQFAQADVFICPSVWQDPLPMVNAEAMASGLPIIAFAKGGIPEIVGDAGILVKEITSQALAKGIIEVLTNPELYQALSIKGIERVNEKFNWHTIAKTWFEQLQQICQEK